jgi:hypothetical protein
MFHKKIVQKIETHFMFSDGTCPPPPPKKKKKHNRKRGKKKEKEKQPPAGK